MWISCNIGKSDKNVAGISQICLSYNLFVCFIQQIDANKTLKRSRDPKKTLLRRYGSSLHWLLFVFFMPFLYIGVFAQICIFVQREWVKLWSCPKKCYFHSPLELFWLIVMSQIESTRWTEYTPLYANEQFESKIIQWRLPKCIFLLVGKQSIQFLIQTHDKTIAKILLSNKSEKNIFKRHKGFKQIK